ncbi:unnamed protein product [Clonostachys chloroleuca]|uniref:Uncharacterized protein n=1 Tax=Clonostachys chloroleuca TaxID=1926264 RepID=A0AA35MJ20_9HYPO|nr:unnamed protein product [Clonostachys chloroleuca]
MEEGPSEADRETGEHEGGRLPFESFRKEAQEIGDSKVKLVDGLENKYKKLIKAETDQMMRHFMEE